MSADAKATDGVEIGPLYLGGGMAFEAVLGITLGFALNALAFGASIGLGLGLPMGLALEAGVDRGA